MAAAVTSPAAQMLDGLGTDYSSLLVEIAPNLIRQLYKRWARGNDINNRDPAMLGRLLLLLLAHLFQVDLISPRVQQGN